ncbi:MAG: Type II secretory pathway, ATPase PulE/Tfp pilus assembly pathway, ATPase PilB [uncultured bacterium]|nr:MAG: Type II secretory pathway, ATPase PulE/Tfp pilus assembly pathway, ATPase PilB [uncultured bacterium]OGT59062.1 MAG: type II secretion system protein GspE [Gammaproteobacteria bacterium RIFCSPHIGHO2_12_FULL_42_10]
MQLSFAKRFGVLVKDCTPRYATILYHETPSLTILSELRRTLERPLILEKIDETTFNEALIAQYESNTTSAMHLAEDLGESFNLHELIDALPKTEDLLEKQNDAPIIRLLNALLSEAIKEQASDIHIETFEDHVAIRFRIDGMLREVLSPQRVLAPLIISRIKVMAKLDIAEKRLPQDGRVRLHLGHRAIDIRVSIIPTNHGERAVLRLLDQKSTPLDLTQLGMDQETQTIIQQLISKPNGIILVTGPTGSGKTTTLYALLSLLNNKNRNILTIEDPIEYALPGIGQTQVNNKINMTFAKGLRAILRQDPDIVMVGEIRDLETAQIAIQASLTGHLVLSTLHTNSAVGAITRLSDMGIAPYLIASSITGVLSERLIRKLCPHCKTPITPKDAIINELHLNPAMDHTLYQALGCMQCKQSGYTGRSGIYELIVIDDKMRSMIHTNTNEQALAAHAHACHHSLKQNGYHRVLMGDTSLEEIWRVAGAS